MNTDYIEKYPVLTAEEQKELLKHRDDPKAREKLILHNQRLVAKVAAKYKGMLDWEELLQEGNIALIKAIDGFDPDRGAKLSTYAYMAINNHLTRAVARGGIIKYGERIHSDKRAKVYSLDELVSEDGEKLVDMIEASEESKAERDAAVINYALSLLDERERDILYELFLNKAPLDVLAKRYGYSKQMIINFRDQALRKLRHPDIIDTLREMLGGDL